LGRFNRWVGDHLAGGKTMKRPAMLMVLLLVTCSLSGCGLDVGVTIVNNTASFVRGDIEGQQWALPCGESFSTLVEAGGFLSDCSEVVIRFTAHQDCEPLSPVLTRGEDLVEICKDREHIYEVFFVSPAKGLHIRPID
jgi:hypothetical protein